MTNLMMMWQSDFPFIHEFITSLSVRTKVASLPFPSTPAHLLLLLHPQLRYPFRQAQNAQLTHPLAPV